MATYAIGDIQGCFRALQRLLEHIDYAPAKDRLLFVGDLVNRGPDSAAVLRFVRRLGDAGVTVLGNHDLHALAIADGRATLREDDSLSDLLTAPDREELLVWLLHRPLLYREDQVVLVHAGLLPFWSVPDAQERAHEVERMLRSNEYPHLLGALYADRTDGERWSDSLTGLRRLCVITNVFTRMRVCTRKGKMALSYKGPPDKVPDGLVPWFQAPDRKNADVFVISGHWSKMGLYLGDNVAVLDSGCVAGRQLSALRLEDRSVFQVSCAGPRPG